MGQLVAEETTKRGELQDAQSEEGLKQHEAGGDCDDGEMVLQQKKLSGAATAAKKKKDQLMKKLHKKENRKTMPYYMLYKYANWIDAVLMLVGSLAAVVNGLILPAMFLIQTKIINALGTLQSQPNQLYSKISKVSMHEQINFLPAAVQRLEAWFCSRKLGRKERNIMAPATLEVSAWAAKDSSGHLAPFTFLRRTSGPRDVKFKVLFCGICHTGLHQIHNDWGSIYPMVPRHESVGEATEVGSEVKAFKVGEIVGVGCIYAKPVTHAHDISNIIARRR